MIFRLTSGTTSPWLAMDSRWQCIWMVNLPDKAVAPPTATDPLPQDFRIAGDGVFDAEDNYFDGTIDEVAIFDRALTAEEVGSLVADPGQNPGDGDGEFADLIATNVQGEMLGVNSSLYVRVPFEVNDPNVFNQMLLEMNYDDGFVAYLNGTEIARRNAPGEEGVMLPYNAAATRHPFG